LPTKKPRMYVTLTPELDKALRELRKVSGVSSSSFVASILSEAVPMVNAVAESFRLAKTGVRAPLEPMKEAINRAMIEGAQISMQLNEHSDVRKYRRARKADTK
jgi:hypothetical protein